MAQNTLSRSLHDLGLSAWFGGTLANAVALFVIPVVAVLADRIGRKPVFLAGVLGPAVLMYPYLSAVHAGNWPLID